MLIIGPNSPAVLARGGGYKNRKFALQEDYFQKIETPSQAYWLGVIWSDDGLS